MRNIRRDLIASAFGELPSKDIVFKSFVLTRRFVKWLFDKYLVEEYSVHYYDSEPDVPAEWDRDGAEWDDPTFKQVWRKLVQEYEPNRILFCNWVDTFGEGIWDWTQDKTDSEAMNQLDELIRTVPDPEDRFYVGFLRDGRAILYFYGRDTFQYDLWFFLRLRVREPLFG